MLVFKVGPINVTCKKKLNKMNHLCTLWAGCTKHKTVSFHWKIEKDFKKYLDTLFIYFLFVENIYLAALNGMFCSIGSYPLLGLQSPRVIENRIYIRVEFRKSIGMNCVSPFQPEREFKVYNSRQFSEIICSRVH